VPELRYAPKFMKADDVRFTGWSTGNYINGRIEGLKAGVVDILYEMEREMMPAIRRWPLDSSTRLRLGPLGRSGIYRIIGIRDSSGPEPDAWIPVNAEFRIRAK
jgi:hypothetical protein